MLQAIAVEKLQLGNNWTLNLTKFYVSRMTYLTTPRSAPGQHNPNETQFMLHGTNQEDLKEKLHSPRFV